MTALYLVRHGQASFGADDYDRLSALGHRQSRWLGDYFAERGIRPARVIIGSLRRHRETWEGMVEGFDAAGIRTPVPEVRPALDEYDPQRLVAAHRAAASAAGAAIAEAGAAGDPADPEVRRAHFRILREALRGWAEGVLTADGHLSYGDFRSGAYEAVMSAWLASAGTADDIVVVSSGGPISSILVQMLGMPDTAFVGLNLQTRNTGYTEFQGGGRRPNLIAFNGISHLDTAERRASITYS
jgi:broad specificity phosphatase PhoE